MPNELLVTRPGEALSFAIDRESAASLCCGCIEVLSIERLC